MKTIVMVVVVAALAAGCSMATPQGAWKDWGVCLEHGIIDAQNCDAAYDSGNFPPKDGKTSRGSHQGIAPAAIEPVRVAQLFGREHHREQPLEQPGYETLRRSQQIMRDHEALRRELELEDHGRRLRDLERQIQIERSNDFYRQRTR